LNEHYTRLRIQPFDIIKANNLDYFEGNVIKYILRHRYKNGAEDLNKAKVYIDELLKEYEDE
jgi:hypothetical protein